MPAVDDRGTLFHQRFSSRQRQAAPAARLRPATAIMDSVPDIPGPQTRTAVTRRIIAHVRRGWPRLGEPVVRHRGRFCYVAVLLPGHREPTPILRLRYQGSADRWVIGIDPASTGQYTESELPASFGPATGTPEQGVDDTFILYAGPNTGHLRSSARTRAQATKPAPGPACWPPAMTSRTSRPASYDPAARSNSRLASESATATHPVASVNSGASVTTSPPTTPFRSAHPPHHSTSSASSPPPPRKTMPSD